MKNALKFLVAVLTIAALWYAILGWRSGTEPIQGGWLLKALVHYQR